MKPATAAIGCAILVVCATTSWLAFDFIVHSQPVTGSKQPQGIVVVTGGAERIGAALAVMGSPDAATPVLISGVATKATLREFKSIHTDSAWAFDCCIDLGTRAKTTCGNAHEAANWLRKRKFSTAALLTSDYHVARARLEITRRWPEGTLLVIPTSNVTKKINGHGGTFIWLSEFIKYSVSMLTRGWIPCEVNPWGKTE